MTTATDYTAAIREIVPDLEYRAEFVPQSKSRNAGDKSPSLNWRVTFSRNGRTLETDYMQGIGHLPGYDHSRKDVDYRRYITHVVETGNALPPLRDPGKVSRSHHVDTPTLADVLHCLLIDAEAIDTGSFEEWAENYGYDTDSRKAEGIYRACLEIGLNLCAILGDELISKLREALQDM